MTTLLSLPTEVIIQILSHLEVADISSLHATCAPLQHIIDDDELWRRIFLQKFHQTHFSSLSRARHYSIELIRRQSVQHQWRKGTSLHKNAVLDVLTVEKAVFQYPRVVAFSDQGTITITSLEKMKTEATIPVTTPQGCTAYHFNKAGAVFGRFDGRIFSKLLGKAAYLGPATEFNEQHDGVVTAIYNDGINSWSGDEHGEVHKWDLRSRDRIGKWKVSDTGILRIKALNDLVLALNNSAVNILENGDIKRIDIDLVNVNFFEVDFGGKLLVIASLDTLKAISFASESFGTTHTLNFSEFDQILCISIEEKASMTSADFRIAGKDGCNLGLITRSGTVACINIRDVNSTNGQIQPHLTFNPTFDNLNLPAGIPPLRSLAVNSSVILLGSYNGFAAVYDILTGELLRLASVRIPKKYLVLTEDNFLYPVSSVHLGQSNEPHGIIVVGNIVQYFLFGELNCRSAEQKKKTKKMLAGISSDRKNKLQKTIRGEVKELERLEYEEYKQEQFLSKYNGNELTEHEQMELAMVLNNSIEEQMKHRREVRAGKEIDDDETDDELAKALEISRLEQEYETTQIPKEELLDDPDIDYEQQLQEALRRSLYE